MKIQLLLSVILFISVGQLHAQDKENNEDAKTEKSSDKKEKSSKIKTYDDIITKDVTTDKGLLMCTRLMKTTFMKSLIVSLDVKCWL